MTVWFRFIRGWAGDTSTRFLFRFIQLSGFQNIAFVTTFDLNDDDFVLCKHACWIAKSSNT